MNPEATLPSSLDPEDVVFYHGRVAWSPESKSRHHPQAVATASKAVSIPGLSRVLTTRS